MQAKIINPVVGVTLCFCPQCSTGHIVEYGQKNCDICGIDIQWPKERRKDAKSIHTNKKR